MQVAICGRNLGDLEQTLRRFPVQLVDRAPDVVISYGGDGALLGAERVFPCVPKFPLRDSRSCPKCPQHAEERMISLLVEGRLAESRLIKLVARTSADIAVTGINDVVINKQNIASAVRYRLWLDGELYKNQIVGDGLVIATPFGSTGYYRSITHSLFRVGLGLAFNNSTEPLDHLVLSEGSEIEVEIIRGPAVLLADNDPCRIDLQKADRVSVTRGPEEAVVLGLDIFRCQACAQRRQPEL